ncbi:hypothetical protein A9Q99_15560 [Gammaproteobacteria bacterium 45_16_T64]|nr:hypothetical protein A9Q99_15560 [Gammaproteobacteria bacterium 45_16_T64]
MDPDRYPYFFHTLAVKIGRSHVITSVYTGVSWFDGLLEAGVLQHELGHNLGLLHGGDDNVVCKPNYPSVMNYNPILALSFDYSHGGNPTLNENHLLEEEGIGKGPIDWNENNIIDSDTVAANINHIIPIQFFSDLIEFLPLEKIPFRQRAFSTERCKDNRLTEIHDFNDWAEVEKQLVGFDENPQLMSRSAVADEGFDIDVTLVPANN